MRVALLGRDPGPLHRPDDHVAGARVRVPPVILPDERVRVDPGQRLRASSPGPLASLTSLDLRVDVEPRLLIRQWDRSTRVPMRLRPDLHELAEPAHDLRKIPTHDLLHGPVLQDD